MTELPAGDPVADAPERLAAAILEPSDPRPATWPQTRLVSWALTGCLFAALAAPWPLADRGGAALALLAFPVIAAVVVTRWLFDSHAVRVYGRVSIRTGLATLLPAAVGTGTMAICAAVAGSSVTWPPLAAAYAGTCSTLFLAASLRAVEVRYWRGSRRIFLVASEEHRADIGREIARHQGMELVGFTPVADCRELAERLAGCRPTMLVLSLDAVRDEAIVAAAADFNLAGGRVRDLGGFYERHFSKVPLSDLTPSWFLFDISEVHRHRAYGVVKRAGELAVSACLLVVLAPLLALVAVAVLASSGRPILFRQPRAGKDGAPFTLIKFRTMVDVDGTAPGWASAHTTRITPAGRFLRRYRLDELPQLVGVLRGDLSLVGPRPEQVPIVRELERSIPYYGARHRVRPGLTGWAQIHHGYGGSRGGTLQKLQYDFFYIKHQSLRLDALILLATARAVLREYSE